MQVLCKRSSVLTTKHKLLMGLGRQARAPACLAPEEWRSANIPAYPKRVGQVPDLPSDLVGRLFVATVTHGNPFYADCLNVVFK